MISLLVLHLIATTPGTLSAGASSTLASPAPHVVTSNRWLSLDGLVASGLNGEGVLLSGGVHVQARVAFSRNPRDLTRIDVRANLAQVEGIGQVTHKRYRATGSASMEPYFAPPGPPVVPYFALTFPDVTTPPPPPGGPIPLPYPLSLGFSVNFDPNGNLSELGVEIYSP